MPNFISKITMISCSRTHPTLEPALGQLQSTPFASPSAADATSASSTLSSTSPRVPVDSLRLLVRLAAFVLEEWMDPSRTCSTSSSDAVANAAAAPVRTAASIRSKSSPSPSVQHPLQDGPGPVSGNSCGGGWGGVIHVCFFESIQTRAKNRAVFPRSESNGKGPTP